MIEPEAVVGRIRNSDEAAICLKLIPEISDLILAKFPELRPDYMGDTHAAKRCSCGDACGC